MLAALGVVFGDIGTSPLYALRECFDPTHGTSYSHAHVLGILSLIFWTLTTILCLKYLSYVMRADNEGEGGTLALLALLHPHGAARYRPRGRIIIACGLIGAAFLYGDGMLTPAISVLSAVEGLAVATPVFEKFVVPITVPLLIGLFYLQRHGTARIGQWFGPIILVWFVVLALLGIRGILLYPSVLAALNPVHAITFLMEEGWHAFVVLGSVFLVVTGAEALYADMGHFGRRPIILSWMFVAFPALVLNYMGQGALIITDPSAVRNPFYLLAPSWALYPLVGLATAATIIASQAVISGAFSVTSQAVQLGYLPRLTIRYTSEHEMGQVYVPLVNNLLLIATVALVLGFESSSNLASAYGIAVASTMIVDTGLMAFVSRDRWKWALPRVLLVTSLLLLIDLMFFASNVLKVGQGGWVPLMVGAGAFVLMSTWRRGREVLGARLSEGMVPLNDFVKDISLASLHRVPGTAIVLHSNINHTPPPFIHHLECNKVLHRQVVFLTIRNEDVPHIRNEDRVGWESLGNGFYRIIAQYGFMEEPNVMEALALAKRWGCDVQLEDLTFVLGRETIIPTRRPGMALWRERLFAFMSVNSIRATEFFKVPRDRVIEIGMQIEI